jgi:hypothetical protein
MPPQVHFALIALNLLAGAGLLVLLGVLTWVSWGVVRTRATTQHYLLRTTRQRLVPGIWVVLFAFVATSIYGEANSASLHLPNAWEAASAAENRGYALLALGGYLFVGQVLLGLGVLTKGSQADLAKRARKHQQGGSDLAAALTSTLILAATLFAVVAMATVGYMQLLAHTAT